MSLLTRSFVRGFGGALGFMTAKGLVKSFSNSSATESSISNKQSWTIFLFWFLVVGILGANFGAGYGTTAFFLGWIPPYLYFYIKNKRDAKELEFEFKDTYKVMFEKYLELAKEKNIVTSVNTETIDSLMKNCDSYKMRFEFEKFQKFIDTIIELREKKYDDDTIQKVVNNEVWIGMDETLLVHSRGKATKVETEELKTKMKRTYVYGNKTSGDTFTFNDGILVGYKDR